MCGLFASMGAPDVDVVHSIASRAATRGPHGFGIFATSPENDTEARLAHAGDITPFLPEIGDFAHRGVLIGHCRLATSGGAADHAAMANAQPITRGRFTIAHNGTARHAVLNELFSSCDSEALLAYMDLRISRPLEYRLQSIDEVVGQGEPAAVIAYDGEILHAFSRGLPLFVRQDPGAVYLCSRRFDGAEPLEQARVHRYKRREL